MMTNIYNAKTNGNPFTNNYHSDDGCSGNSYFRNRCNSENERKGSVLRPIQSEAIHNRSDHSEKITNLSNTSLKNISATLHSLNLGGNTLAQISNNPFNKVAQKVKKPQLLHKTISEDFLFRKLSMTNGVSNETMSHTTTSNGSPNNGASWNISRLMLPEASTFNSWRRNNSQTSLDSIESTGSSESLVGERVLSCDSMNGTTDTTTDSLDNSLRYQQATTYTQITGYLRVRLDYNNM